MPLIHRANLSIDVLSGVKTKFSLVGLTKHSSLNQA